MGQIHPRMGVGVGLKRGNFHLGQQLARMMMVLKTFGLGLGIRRDGGERVGLERGRRWLRGWMEERPQ